MNLVIYDFNWMAYNVFLAIIPIFFGWLMLKVKPFPLRLFFGLLWLIFLPNTIYLLTDIIHIFEDLPRSSGIYTLVILIFYALLMLAGVFTFVIGFHPLERFIRRFQGKRRKVETDAILFVTNILVAFGMVLGRFQRTNSWDIVLNPIRVIEDGIKVFSSVKLIAIFILFAALCNILYFSLRKVGFIRWLFAAHYGGK